MFCFKCGKRLPAKVVNCPECDTPQKRRQRYRRRMFLGLFIFLAGAVCGSLFDTVFFKGKAWNHSFLGLLNSKEKSASELQKDSPVLATETEGLSPDESKGINPEEFGQTHVEAGPIESGASDSISVPDQVSSSVASASEMSDVKIATEAKEISSGDEEIILASSSEELQPQTPANDASGKLIFSSLETIEKSSGSDYHGFLSRNGSEYVFSSNREKTDGRNIYQCYVKGSNLKKAAEKLFSWSGNVWTPELTPDSKTVIFSSDSSKAEHIFAYDRSSGKTSQLTSGTGKNMMPCISPDGKMLVFVSNKSGSNDIWLMGIDGTNLLQLTDGKEDDREPRWADGGRSIIFTRIFQPMKNSQIMQMQLDPMGDPKALIGTNERNWLGDMSPDGSTLAYVRSLGSGGSKNRIIIRDLKTDEEKILELLNGAECFRPVWNNDSLGLVFHAAQGNSRNLFLARFEREKNN